MLLIFLKSSFQKNINLNVNFNVTLILFTFNFTHGIQIFSKSNSCHPSSLFSYHCAPSLWWIQPKDFCPLSFKLLSNLLPLRVGKTCDLLLTNIKQLRRLDIILLTRLHYMTKVFWFYYSYNPVYYLQVLGETLEKAYSFIPYLFFNLIYFIFQMKGKEIGLF